MPARGQSGSVRFRFHVRTPYEENMPFTPKFAVATFGQRMRFEQIEVRALQTGALLPDAKVTLTAQPQSTFAIYEKEPSTTEPTPFDDRRVLKTNEQIISLVYDLGTYLADPQRLLLRALYKEYWPNYGIGLLILDNGTTRRTIWERDIHKETFKTRKTHEQVLFDWLKSFDQGKGAPNTFVNIQEAIRETQAMDKELEDTGLESTPIVALLRNLPAAIKPYQDFVTETKAQIQAIAKRGVRAPLVAMMQRPPGASKDKAWERYQDALCTIASSTTSHGGFGKTSWGNVIRLYSWQKTPAQIIDRLDTMLDNLRAHGLMDIKYRISGLKPGHYVVSFALTLKDEIIAYNPKRPQLSFEVEIP